MKLRKYVGFGAYFPKPSIALGKCHAGISYPCHILSGPKAAYQGTAAKNALLFLTRKRDGSNKARKCADGNKQRFEDGYEKNNGAAPTVATDSAMTTAAIAAHAIAAHQHCDHDNRLARRLSTYQQ